MEAQLPRPSHMWRDFQFGWRLLRRSPGFTAVAVLTLALGIGANTTMFSVLDAILFQPPAYPNPGGLVVLQRYYPRNQKIEEQISAPDWKDFTERSRSLESLAVYTADTVTLTHGDEVERLPVTAVSANLLAVLQVSPLLGRGFQSDDTRPNAPVTALLSESLWRSHFGGDPSIIGQSLAFAGLPVRVIGVMPASFAFPDRANTMWLPLRISPRDLARRNVYWMRTIGRLRPGISVEAARAELVAVAGQVARESPDTNTGQSVAVISLQQYLAGNSRAALLVLGAAVAFVLLIVCANLASLLLARASARSAEFAVRAALGAARPQLLRQLLAEGVLLAALGGAGGMLVAVWGVDALRLVAMSQFSRASEIHVNAPVLCFGLAASLLCGIVFGLAPAFAATRDALSRGSARTTKGGSTARGFLVAAEVAMAFALLVGAGLMTQSLWKLYHVDPGFTTGHLLTYQIMPRLSDFQTRAQVGSFYEDLLSRIRLVPGVKAAGAVGNLPLSGGRSGTSIAVENRPMEPGESISANYQLTGPGYFAAMGIPIVAGRDFSTGDSQNSQDVVIINRALANLCWPGQDAVGRRMRLGPNPNDPWSTVVGVIGDVRHDALALPPRPEAYENYFQHVWGLTTIVVRHSPEAAAVPSAISALIKQAGKHIPTPPSLSMDDVIASSLRDQRFLMWMLAGFAACAILLAAIGIYGVMAYAVTQRTREIGIRLALGAARRDVTRLVFAGGIRLAAAGVVAGSLLALVLVRFLRTMLFQVKPGDPATLACAAAILAAFALVACIVPAVRAARVEASVALRHE